MVLDIQNHSMTVIASDASNLKPVDVDSIYSNPGERFDFVLQANKPGGELKNN